jgi:hypothetical protein
VSILPLDTTPHDSGHPGSCHSSPIHTCKRALMSVTTSALSIATSSFLCRRRAFCA